ncbi:hypothetical protein DPMN_098414 [Dreissena polymorpha]|uniref:HAT C-terminal dimerisation domain-containing protein n=1 Tax=Dreissena polymorpha TaxID=45954 RepID=A0A9D4LDK2_DREPO|nr:hypothetical protein DPMN_098414 [Dreissena polymorpha]
MTDDLHFVVELYTDDVEKQLESLKSVMDKKNYSTTNNVSIKDIVQVSIDMKPASRTMFSEIATVLKLILVMPATNATSERTFSALRRIKT